MSLIYFELKVETIPLFRPNFQRVGIRLCVIFEILFLGHETPFCNIS